MAVRDRQGWLSGVIVGLAAMSLVASGCAFGPFDSHATVERNETFEFVLQASDTSEEEAAKRVVALTGPLDDAGPTRVEGVAIPETVEHLAWINLGDHRLDFYAYETSGRGNSTCSMTIYDSAGASSGCGNPPVSTFDAFGTSTGGAFHSAEFYVGDDVATIVGIANDGTKYTIIPHNGQGYVEWRAERGGLDLVAFDEAGLELATHSAP